MIELLFLFLVGAVLYWLAVYIGVILLFIGIPVLVIAACAIALSREALGQRLHHDPGSSFKTPDPSRLRDARCESCGAQAYPALTQCSSCSVPYTRSTISKLRAAYR